MVITVNPLEIITKQDFDDLEMKVSKLFESYGFRHDISVKYESHEEKTETIMEFYVDIDVDDYGNAIPIPSYWKNKRFYDLLVEVPSDSPSEELEDLPF